MTIPRFPALLWEEARRGLPVRCYGGKPGEVRPLFADSYGLSFSPIRLLSPSRQAVTQQHLPFVRAPSTSGERCGLVPVWTHTFWSHQDAGVSFFSARESMWCLSLKLLHWAIRKPKGEPRVSVRVFSQLCGVPISHRSHVSHPLPPPRFCSAKAQLGSRHFVWLSRSGLALLTRVYHRWSYGMVCVGRDL